MKHPTSNHLFGILALAVYIFFIAFLWQHWNQEDQPLIFEGYDVLAEIVDCDTDADCMEKNPHLGDF